MIKISDAVKTIVGQNTYLEEFMSQGLINLSALARDILPTVNKLTMKTVQPSAVVMALKRYGDELAKKQFTIQLRKFIKNYTVRTNLVEFTFANSPNLVNCQYNLMSSLVDNPEAMLNISQAIFETTLIASSELADSIVDLFSTEKLLSRIDNLAAISIKQDEVIVSTPGVYYQILKHLAFANINIVEVVSTFTELTIIFRREDLEKAFSVVEQMRLN